MITEQSFANIDQEVRDSLNAVFDFMKNSYPLEYIVFLADGEYKAEYLQSTPKREPYVIDNREDLYMDETRVRFLVEFLKTFYTFPVYSVDVDQVIPWQIDHLYCWQERCIRTVKAVIKSNYFMVVY